MSIAGNLASAAASLLDAMEDAKIGVLTLSALMGLEGSDPLDVTRKPVDQGFVMTDAAVKMPMERTMEICLADPELSPEALVQAALSGNTASLTMTWRHKKDLLYQLFNDRELVVVQTHEEVFESMLIQDIIPHYDINENWDAFFATVFVMEVRVVEGSAAGGLLDQALDAVGSA